MADKKLGEVRTQFVEKVNKAVIRAVLDDLQEKGVLNEEETEEVKEKSGLKQEQARALIDAVRRKGPKASFMAIQSISCRDAFLAEQLGLMTFLEDKKLRKVRKRFVKKVNKAVICTVLDDLLEKRVLNDEEVEKVKLESVTQEQARTLIDGVRKKGHKASLIAIKSICARDAFLAELLGLTAFLEVTSVASAPAPLTSVVTVPQGLTRSALEPPSKKSKKKAKHRKRSPAPQHQQSKSPRCRDSAFSQHCSFLSSEAMASFPHRGQTTILPFSHPSTPNDHISTCPHCRVSPIHSVDLPPIPRTPSPTSHWYQSPILSDDDVSEILPHQDEPRSDEQQGQGVPFSCPPFNPQDQRWSKDKHAPSQLSMDDSASLLLKPEELMQPDSEAETENTSLSSPDDTIRDPSAPSPTDDLTLYNEQLISMAKALSLEYMFTEPKSTDPITKVLYTPESGAIMLPLLQGIRDIAMRIWAIPSSTPASAEKLEKLYKIRKDEASFLFKHPKANSLVSEVLSAKGRSGTHLAPSDEEGCYLDELGCKTYSSGAMGLRVSNLTAIMGCYQIDLWNRMRQLVNYVPEDKKPLAMELLLEGQNSGMPESQQLERCCFRIQEEALLLPLPHLCTHQKPWRRPGWPSLDHDSGEKHHSSSPPSAKPALEQSLSH